MKFLPVVLDTDHLRHRMLKRLAEIGQSARGAAESAGLRESTIRNLMNGSSKSPRLGTILKVAQALKVEPGWFLSSSIHEEDETTDNRLRVDMNKWFDSRIVKERQKDIAEKIKSVDFMLNETIQLYYPIKKRDGSYSIKPNQMFVDKPKLPDVKLFHQYIFWVRDDTMWPVFRKGDQLLMNKECALREDEDYLFSTDWNSEERRNAYLARLLAFDDTKFHVMLFKPKRKITLSRKEYIYADGVAARFFLTRSNEEDEEGGFREI